MTFQLKSDGKWHQNGAGLWVQSEPIDRTLVAAAATDQVVAKKSDGTLYFRTVSGGGGATVLYDSGALASAANTIDSGAAGIAGGYDVLEIFALLRTDETVARSSIRLRFNADSGNNYRYQYINGIGGSASAGNNVTDGCAIDTPGASATSGVPQVVQCTVPFYTGTVFQKQVACYQGNADSSSSTAVTSARTFNWANTSAITRVSFHAPSGKNFIAGSHVIVYGR